MRSIKMQNVNINLLTSQIIWIFGCCSTPAWCGAETKKPTPRCWAHSSCPAKQCLGRRACASRLPNIGRQKLAENARLIETPFVDKRAARMLQGGPLVHVLQGSYFCWRIMDVEGATISDCHVMQIYWYFNYVSTINWSESIPAWWFPQIYLRCKILQFSADHNLSRQNYGVPPSPGPHSSEFHNCRLDNSYLVRDRDICDCRQCFHDMTLGNGKYLAPITVAVSSVCRWRGGEPVLGIIIN